LQGFSKPELGLVVVQVFFSAYPLASREIDLSIDGRVIIAPLSGTAARLE
jgi:hypothetical protein